MFKGRKPTPKNISPRDKKNLRRQIFEEAVRSPIEPSEVLEIELGHRHALQSLAYEFQYQRVRSFVPTFNELLFLESADNPTFCAEPIIWRFRLCGQFRT